MTKQNTQTYKTSDAFWVDESGVSIPVSRVTKTEKKVERYSAAILKKAIKLNADLKAFKQDVTIRCAEIADAILADLKSGATRKGNFTFYSFNRHIKIVVDVQERIDFDDLTIEAAKDKLEEFLDEKIESEPMVKELVLTAFNKSRGKLDVKKVLSLLKYREKVNDSRFSEALDLIEKAIRRPQSKSYFRIWQKDATGEYELVDLNFSSVK